MWTHAGESAAQLENCPPVPATLPGPLQTEPLATNRSAKREKREKAPLICSFSKALLMALTARPRGGGGENRSPYDPVAQRKAKKGGLVADKQYFNKVAQKHTHKNPSKFIFPF